jgi:hypothetical protein
MITVSLNAGNDLGRTTTEKARLNVDIAKNTYCLVQLNESKYSASQVLLHPQITMFKTATLLVILELLANVVWQHPSLAPQ